MNAKKIMRTMVSQSNEIAAAAALAKQVRRLEMTAVVDDDFPEVKHAYEGALADLIRAMKANGRFTSGNRYGLRP